MRESARIGRMGEFLAAHLFEAHGMETVHVDRDGADLWVQVPDGSIVAVSVKTSSRPTADDGRPTPRYCFNHRRRLDGVDFYGFVALDTRLMVVLPACEVGSVTSKWPASRFTPEAMTASIERMRDAGQL